MKSIWTLIFVLLLFGSFAQRIRNCDCGNKQDTVKQYYEMVYLAEQFIMKGNIDSALFYYGKAELLNINIMQELVNVHYCLSNCQNDSIKIPVFVNRFIHTSDTISVSKYIEWVSFYLSDTGADLLRTAISDVKKVNVSDPINYKDLIKIFEEMELEDQRYRGEFGIAAGERKNVAKIDSRNMRKIMQLYKVYGCYKTNRLFGGGFTGFCIILTHNFQDRRVYNKYNDFFINEVLAGRLDPRAYANIVDNYLFDSTQVYGYHTIFSVGDTLIVYQLSEAGKQHFDVNRKRIFLPDTETTHHKLIWQWQHDNEYIFIPMCEIGISRDFPTAKSIADAHLKAMGSFVTGYRFYTR